MATTAELAELVDHEVTKLGLAKAAYQKLTGVDVDLETEKATQRADLPHDFAKGLDGFCSVCGRNNSNELHETNLVEKAHAQHTEIVTEKGI